MLHFRNIIYTKRFIRILMQTNLTITYYFKMEQNRNY